MPLQLFPEAGAGEISGPVDCMHDVFVKLWTICAWCARSSCVNQLHALVIIRW